MKKTSILLLTTSFFLGLLFCLNNVSLGQEKISNEGIEKNENVQEEYYRSDYLRHDNYVYNSDIKSVMLHLKDDELSPPVIPLESDQALKLSFDIFDLNLKNYMYAFVHCDADWNPSPINEMEYLNGFFENYITDYQFSFNTIKRYIHYNLLFPNDNVSFKTSGNYLLIVYQEGNRDLPVITRRFMVYEEKIIIDPNVVKATIPDERDSKQKVDFSILHNGYTILNPNEDLRVAVLQNYRWDNAKTSLKPLFIKESELIYNYDNENLFSGENEFRHFDFKTLRFQTENVQSIAFEKGENHVYLKEDLVLSTAPYSTQPDINGKFAIRLQEGFNSEIEADYAYVHFKLKYPTPVTGGNLYIFGALSDWTYPNSFKLKYDYESRSYHATLFLKQGYYNYNYSFLQDGSNAGSAYLIDGSYFETENDYAIFAYHKEPSTNYFKIIGYTHFNSLTAFNVNK